MSRAHSQALLPPEQVHTLLQGQELLPFEGGQRRHRRQLGLAVLPAGPAAAVSMRSEGPTLAEGADDCTHCRLLAAQLSGYIGVAPANDVEVGEAAELQGYDQGSEARVDGVCAPLQLHGLLLAGRLRYGRLPEELLDLTAGRAHSGCGEGSGVEAYHCCFLLFSVLNNRL